MNKADIITEIYQRIAAQQRHLRASTDRHTGVALDRERRGVRAAGKIEALEGVLELLGVTS